MKLAVVIFPGLIRLALDLVFDVYVMSVLVLDFAALRSIAGFRQSRRHLHHRKYPLLCG